MTRPDIYLDNPPPSDQRIGSLHAWIATYADGSEGIMSADLPVSMPNGDTVLRHMPLLTSKLPLAEKLEPVALHAQKLAASQANRVVTVRLVTFNRA